jgi:hypothetical protein
VSERLVLAVVMEVPLDVLGVIEVVALEVLVLIATVEVDLLVDPLPIELLLGPKPRSTKTAASPATARMTRTATAETFETADLASVRMLCRRIMRNPNHKLDFGN